MSQILNDLLGVLSLPGSRLAPAKEEEPRRADVTTFKDRQGR